MKITDEMQERMEWTLAPFFSLNRQPHMSGDPRERLSPLQRRNLTYASRYALEAALTAAPPSAAEPVAMWQRQPVNSEHWLEVEEAHIEFYRERGQKIRALYAYPEVTP